MGNASSTEGSASTDGSNDGGGPTVSGVSLGKNLEAALVQEFQAKVHAEFLQRVAHKKQQEAANAQIQNNMEQYLGERKAIHDELDGRLETLSGMFHDKLIAADHDASTLQQKYCKPEQILGTEAPCAEVRNNYVNCQQNGKPAACEIYIQALQDCVTKAVTS